MRKIFYLIMVFLILGLTREGLASKQQVGNLMFGSSTETTLSSAGVAQSFGTTTERLVTSFSVIAPLSNAGTVYFGSGVSMASTTSGYPVAPGETVKQEGDMILGSSKYFDLRDWYWNGNNSGDKIRVIFFK